MKSFQLFICGLMIAMAAESVSAQEDMGWPPPTAVGEEQQEGGTPWLLAQTVTFPDGVGLVISDLDTATVCFFTPDELDKRWPIGPDDVIAADDPDSLRKYVIKFLNTERRQTQSDLERYFGPVTLVMVVASNHPLSRNTFRLTSACSFGLLRDGQDIPAKGISLRLSADPGVMDWTYVVFKEIDFRPDDVFYITFPAPPE